MRDDAHGTPHRFMEWNTWRDALEGLRGMPSEVHLCPHWLGEPTLHPNFDRFVEYAFANNTNNELFREFKLHTNGVLFSEYRAKLLVELAQSPWLKPATFKFIHFSIDALSPEVYTTVKGRSRQPQAYRNIHRFLEIRKQRQAALPFVTLAFVVQPENHQEAKAFVDYWTLTLERLGRKVVVSWDWPCQESDTIYLRPLNCGDQATADQLHADVCAELGISPPNQSRLRDSESF